MKQYKYQYAVIQTLMGNFRLKELSKAITNNDYIEIELYSDSMNTINSEYKAHMKYLKENNLI